MAVLHAIEGPLRGRIFGIPETPRLTVGRYEIYDVVVPEPSISRKHFVLEQRQDGCYITDLGSLNGTQLNGRRISTAKLEHGDLITVGQSVLCYDETNSPTPPVASAGDIPLPVLDPYEEEPLEEISDDDIVELESGVGPPPTSKVIELPDEVIDLPDGPPPTVPIATSDAREAVRKRRLRTDIGSRKTLRVSNPLSPLSPLGPAAVEVTPSDSRRGVGRRGAGRATSPPVASGPPVEKCVACGRGVSQEEMNAGEGANTRKGYLCGHCVDERQKSGIKGLDKFIRYRRRQHD